MDEPARYAESFRGSWLEVLRLNTLSRKLTQEKREREKQDAERMAAPRNTPGMDIKQRRNHGKTQE